jgi:hypothetical protein
MSNVLIVFLVLALLSPIKYNLEKSECLVLLVRGVVVTMLLEEIQPFRHRLQIPVAPLRKKLRKQMEKERELKAALIVILVVVAVIKLLAIIVFLFRLTIACRCVFLIGKSIYIHLRSFLRLRSNLLERRFLDINILQLNIIGLILRTCLLIIKKTIESLKKLNFFIFNYFLKLSPNFYLFNF